MFPENTKERDKSFLILSYRNIWYMYMNRKQKYMYTYKIADVHRIHTRLRTV